MQTALARKSFTLPLVTGHCLLLTDIMPLLPGELLHKRYRITCLLSQGRYGATYRAWDVNARQDVAIKEYRDPTPETQKLFRQEARRLSKLAHPQLPAVLDHFALDDVGQYLVTAYVDGVDVQALLGQYGRFPSDLIIQWLQAACHPLAYLHQHKQLHLDVKPANIRITPTGEVFLVDSGLPGLGIRPHTEGYGAPEQQAQTEANTTSDIYSLGATLYTLLTGKTPPTALSRQSGLADLKPAREVNPDIEPYLSIVAGRAMSLRPDTRYESVIEFAKALERPIGNPAPEQELRRTPDVPVFAPPPRFPTRTRKQIEQRTIIGLLGLLGIVLLLALGLTLSNFGQPEVDEAAATATSESALVAALTAIAPTPTPIPPPTEPPTPAPAPFLTKTGSRMLYVADGIFRIGDDEGEADERPSNLIKLDAFYMDETEVTNAQYAQCVDAGVCDAPERLVAAFYLDGYYGNPSFNDYPVVNVNWYDAQTFCEWREARLPSEAEWEKAASFEPTQSLKFRFPWGDVFDGAMLNYAPTDDGYRGPAPVGSYANGRSPVGLYDMAGNVMEWVADWYNSRTYRDMTDTNPLGPAEGQFKVIRGGSWLSDAEEDLATITRTSFDPLVARDHLGFRCAMTPP